MSVARALVARIADLRSSALLLLAVAIAASTILTLSLTASSTPQEPAAALRIA